MPVGIMLQSLGSREISEWMAYFIVEDEEAKKEMAKQEAESKLANRHPSRRR